MNKSKLPALDATLALVIMRVGLGALFVSTFFENLHKQLYTAAGYAGLIRYYIQYGHAPAIWKQVMGVTAANAAITGPMQGVLEASLGVALVVGLFSRLAALVALGLLTGLWLSEWGLSWIWELLIPMIVAAALAFGPSGERAAVDVARWCGAGRSFQSEPVRVSVVIPTYNEAQSIGLVLADIPVGMVEQVLVVDSESTDGTAQIAHDMGAKVLHEPRRGYGRACLTGLAAVNSPDVVVFLDGDYSDRPAEMSSLLEPLRNGAADIVIGSRLAGERMAGSMPWHAVAGNRLAARLIAFLSGVRLTDLGPFRAARYQSLIALELRESNYGWPVEMIVKGARRGLRITEVPVSYHPRIGSSKISGTVRGSFGAAWGILGAILKYQLFDSTTKREGNR